MKEKPSTSIVPAPSDNALTAFKAAIEQSPEILTGVLGTLLPGALIPARLFHAGMKGRLVHQLMVELEDFRKKGQINEDYLKSEPAAACFSDLLDHIDRISPDPERYKAIHEAFIRTIRRAEMGKNAPHAQQLLRVVYGLSASEILVLAAIYPMGNPNKEIRADSWLNEVANKSGLLRSELVEETEYELIQKRLIHSRIDRANNPAHVTVINIWGMKNRMTILGQEVCELIMRTDIP